MSDYTFGVHVESPEDTGRDTWRATTTGGDACSGEHADPYPLPAAHRPAPGGFNRPRIQPALRPLTVARRYGTGRRP